MHCFIHQDKEAVAICRACSKGLCSECGVDTGRGLGCRGRCEQEVRDYVELIDRSIQIHKQGVGSVSVLQSGREQLLKRESGLTTTVARHIQWTRRFRLSVAAFHCVVGLILAGWGVSDIEKFLFPLVLGICFLAYGVFSFMQARRASEPPQKQKGETQTA